MSIVTNQDLATRVREAFNFEVEKFPLQGPDGMKTPWYALFRSDTNSVVGNGSVTQRYVPHKTEDVCTLVEAAAEAFDGQIDLQTHFRDGHYVNVMPTNEGRLKVYGEADNAFPRIIINAGYDGRSFSATLGYYRDACKNLAMMRKVSGTTVSIRHTSGLRDHLDELIATFNTLKESWGNLASVINRLQSQEVRMVDFLDSIYGRPSDEQLAAVAAGSKIRAVTQHRNRTEAIWNRLNRERNLTGRPKLESTVSAWEAYNAIQGYVQHDAQSKAEFSGSFDRILRASRDPHVRKAEELVLSMTA